MTEHRAGFACFVGRPNAGKSTLTNAIIGQKIAITSSRPQTTRHAIRGIVHRTDGQLVIVDTPGLHRPRTLLGQRLNDIVRATWAEVDVIGVCIPANEDIGAGDRYIAGEMAAIGRTPKIAVVTKTDLVGSSRLAEQLTAVAALGEEAGLPWADVIPVSATSGEGVAALVDHVVARLPDGPQYYPDDMITDVPEAFWVAELVREQLLAHAREELPHSIATRITEWEWPYIRCEILVERDSQKAIAIGKGGSVLKAVGTAVRAQLAEGAYLELHVKVDKDWQRRPKALDRLGY